MDKNSGALRGVIPILATPFAEDESLDLGSWQRLIEFMVGLGVGGVTILGVLGESNRLTDRERETLIQSAVAAVMDANGLELEPGEPLIITGHVFKADGKTPAEGMVLWVYHTDRTGYYNEKDDASHPRLNGWMKIGADGKYEFRTIRPGAYPHRTTPAHIHAHLYGPGFSERSIEDYWFKDDPRVTDDELKKMTALGGHPVIVEVKRGADGVWRGERDITVPAAK